MRGAADRNLRSLERDLRDASCDDERWLSVALILIQHPHLHQTTTLRLPDHCSGLKELVGVGDEMTAAPELPRLLTDAEKSELIWLISDIEGAFELMPNEAFLSLQDVAAVLGSTTSLDIDVMPPPDHASVTRLSDEDEHCFHADDEEQHHGRFYSWSTITLANGRTVDVAGSGDSCDDWYKAAPFLDHLRKIQERRNAYMHSVSPVAQRSPSSASSACQSPAWDTQEEEEEEPRTAVDYEVATKAEPPLLCKPTPIRSRQQHDTLDAAAGHRGP